MSKHNEPSEVATIRPELRTPDADNAGELPEIELDNIAGGQCNVIIVD